MATSAAGDAAAQVETAFGPSPRALDNRAIFDAARIPEWQALSQAGVSEVVLNATFLLTREPGRNGRRRPEGTWLGDAQIEGMSRILRETGLELVYEAGSALGHDLCAAGLSPAEIGEIAARREYDSAVARLHRAGITVSALNIDGPFLKLVPDSNKGGSCAVEDGSRMNLSEVVLAAQAYMGALRDLVRRGNPAGDEVDVNLVVNLPNWQVLDLPRTGNPDGPATTDLNDIMSAFAKVQGETRSRPGRLVIDEIVIDYPYAMILNGRDLYRDRVRHLWNMTRSVNGDDPAPDFGVIANTLPSVRDCPDAGPNQTPFLPWRRDGQAISDDCLIDQIGLSQGGGRSGDRAFVTQTLDYADALRPGGVFDRMLTTANGTQILDHLDHVYLQSWGANPVFNVWFMGEVIEFMDTRY